MPELLEALEAASVGVTDPLLRMSYSTLERWVRGGCATASRLLALEVAQACPRLARMGGESPAVCAAAERVYAQSRAAIQN